MTPDYLVQMPDGYERDHAAPERMPRVRPASAQELARATKAEALLHGPSGRERWVPALLLDRGERDACVTVVVEGEARRVHRERVR